MFVSFRICGPQSGSRMMILILLAWSFFFAVSCSDQWKPVVLVEVFWNMILRFDEVFDKKNVLKLREAENDV